jgi:hypothetical protein
VSERWLICVGGGYGCLIFDGTEEEAEEMRAHKANWEQAVARKTRASDAEKIEKELDAFEVVDPWRAEKLEELTRTASPSTPGSKEDGR